MRGKKKKNSKLNPHMSQTTQATEGGFGQKYRQIVGPKGTCDHVQQASTITSEHIAGEHPYISTSYYYAAIISITACFPLRSLAWVKRPWISTGPPPPTGSGRKLQRTHTFRTPTGRPYSPRCKSQLTHRGGDVEAFSQSPVGLMWPCRGC